MIEEKKYRKVESIFADFNKSIVSMEKTDNLDKDGDFSELSKQYATLSDGQVIEICFWHESDMYLYDLSVDVEKFDAANDTSFEDYMKDKGIYTENIEEVSGTKWKYCGDQQAEEKGVHRLQFFMEDWD
jgi:hypothetical protein